MSLEEKTDQGHGHTCLLPLEIGKIVLDMCVENGWITEDDAKKELERYGTCSIGRLEDGPERLG